MKDIVAFIMLFPMLIFFLIQPMLHEVERYRGDAAMIAIERATEKAAVEGSYTTEIIEEIFYIMEGVGYSRDEVELMLTTDETLRGDYVSGSIKVPNKYFFLLASSLMNSSEEEEMYHIRSATRMSEFLN